MRGIRVCRQPTVEWLLRDDHIRHLMGGELEGDSRPCGIGGRPALASWSAGTGTPYPTGLARLRGPGSGPHRDSSWQGKRAPPRRLQPQDPPWGAGRATLPEHPRWSSS
eukprot:6021414-Pyramimonas_sp.AAC.2